MSFRLTFLAIFVLGALSVSCGGKTAITPDNIDETRALGINFGIKINTLIAFSREIKDDENPYGKSTELFVMFPDGTNQKRLTFNHVNDDCPAWSPNGNSIAFLSDRTTAGSGTMDIFRYNPWGDDFQLTDDTWQWDALSCDWAAGRIYSSRLNHLIGAPFDVVSIVTLNPDGSEQDFVNTGHVASYDAAVSPDGNLVAFSARPKGPTYFDDLEIYVYNNFTGESERLTFYGEGNDPMDLIFSTNAAFDFTGRKVVFQTTAWGNTELAMLIRNTAGQWSNPYRLTWTSANEMMPCFSPDGNWILYVSDAKDKNFEIYKMRAGVPGGSANPPSVRLTFTPENEMNPDWSGYFGGKLK